MAKPVVDGIERQLEGQAQVIRVNALGELGREGAMRFDVRAVPTLIVFDGCGQIVDRQIGFVNAGRVVEAVAAAQACEPQEQAAQGS